MITTILLMILGGSCYLIGWLDGDSRKRRRLNRLERIHQQTVGQHVEEAV